MDKNITSYVKVFSDCIPTNFCEETVKELEDSEFEQHSYYDVKTNNTKSYDNEFSISFSNVKHKQFIMQRIWDSLHDYISELNKQNFVWFQSWSGFSEVRFNRYSTNTRMNIHCDHIQSLFEGDAKGVPILSILGCLNNNYTGGELVFWRDQVINLKAGDIMIFPSNFLYPHHVNLVNSGTRYSFVSWAW